MPHPILAVTVGDPAGIGPEICLKAVAGLRDRMAARMLALVLIGDAETLRAT